MIESWDDCSVAMFEFGAKIVVEIIFDSLIALAK